MTGKSPVKVDRVELPGSVDVRTAARMAYAGGFELRVAWTPSLGLVVEKAPLREPIVLPFRR
jgi:hypothetical protein